MPARDDFQVQPGNRAARVDEVLAAHRRKILEGVGKGVKGGMKILGGGGGGKGTKGGTEILEGVGTRRKSTRRKRIELGDYYDANSLDQGAYTLFPTDDDDLDNDDDDGDDDHSF